MDLKHYPAGDGPFTFDRSRTYGPTRRYDKPDGLWVSVKGDDDWQQWTQREEFSADSTVDENEHTVTLADTAQLLTVGTVAHIDAFTAEYGLPGLAYDIPDGWRIDWPRLAREYDGIIIAPYQWRRRNNLSTFWYAGWDCASGCIWNLDAIAAVVTPEQVAA